MSPTHAWRHQALWSVQQAGASLRQPCSFADWSPPPRHADVGAEDVTSGGEFAAALRTGCGGGGRLGLADSGHGGGGLGAGLQEQVETRAVQNRHLQGNGLVVL
ncbi:MAG: hypothetical protein JWR85_3471 [Marmoricola sp.]|nr:hypothetical protein [Marmoricola sp.]